MPKWQNQGGGFGALQAPATIRMRFLEACAFVAETGLPSLPIKGWLNDSKPEGC